MLTYLRMSIEVRQSVYFNFLDLLTSIASGWFPRNDRLRLQSTARRYTEYRWLWKWHSRSLKEDDRLESRILCSKNALVDEHKREALETFPGDIINLSSSNKLEQRAPSPKRQANPVRQYLKP